MNKILMFMNLAALIIVTWIYRDWEDEYKLQLNSFKNIQESIVRRGFGENKPYDHDLFYVKPIFWFLTMKIPVVLEYAKMVLILVLMLSLQIFIDVLDLNQNYQILTHLMVLINPYIYEAVLMEDLVLIEFFFIILYFHLIFKKQNLLFGSIIAGFLVYLHLHYVLLIIFIIIDTKNHKNLIKYLSIIAAVFAGFIGMSYCVLNDWVG